MPRPPALRRSSRLPAGPAAATLVLAVVLGSATACGNGADAAPESATVIATTSIWADVVENVACNGIADVETLVPAGGDPHGFEPSLADRAALENAQLVVRNGLGLEEGLDDTLEAVAGGGTPVFAIAEEIDTIGYSGTADQDESGEDPHVWFDPSRVAAALPALATRLVDDVGLDAAEVDRCLTSYVADLDAVDEQIQTLVAAVAPSDRRLVTNHDSLGYFADRYGFEIEGTVIPAASGLAETNPARLDALAEVIATTGVAAIFAESQHSIDDAAALAREVDAEVITLDTGTLDPDANATGYTDFLLTNASRIADALGGDR